MTVENDTVEYPDVFVIDEDGIATFVAFNEYARDFLLELNLLGNPVGEMLLVAGSRVNDVIWACYEFGLISE